MEVDHQNLQENRRSSNRWRWSAGTRLPESSVKQAIEQQMEVERWN